MDINIKDLTDEQKEDLKRQLKVDEKIDFSEYVGRLNDTLCIKGKHNLISRESDGISYLDSYQTFNDKLHYEKTTISELKKGDIFIGVTDTDNMSLSRFKCFAGKDSDDDYCYYYLSEDSGLELVKNFFYHQYQGETKVYKFLRD